MDFQNVIPFLKSSIKHIEKLDFQPENKQKEQNKKLLDIETVFNPDHEIEIGLTNKESKIPLLNMAEFLYFARPEKSAVFSLFLIIYHRYKLQGSYILD